MKMQAGLPEASNGINVSSSGKSNRMKKRMKAKLNGYAHEPNEADIEMGKIELLKLLSIFEGELQARDEVIKMLVKQQDPHTSEK